jgi:hypothetical protein
MNFDTFSGVWLLFILHTYWGYGAYPFMKKDPEGFFHMYKAAWVWNWPLGCVETWKDFIYPYTFCLINGIYFNFKWALQDVIKSRVLGIV